MRGRFFVWLVEHDIRGPWGPASPSTALLRISTPRAASRSRHVGGEAAHLYARHGVFNPWFESTWRGGFGKRTFFFVVASYPSITPMTSDSFMIREILPVDLDLGAGPTLPNSTRSRCCTSSGTSLLASVTGSPWPRRRWLTSPSCGFSLAVSGMMMPPLRLVLSFDAAVDDAVVQWTKFHEFLSEFCPFDTGPGRRRLARRLEL